MRLKRTQGGYHTETYKKNLGAVTPRLLIGSGLELVPKFDSKTRRPIPGNVGSTRLWLYYAGLGVQAVKLPADYRLPRELEDLSEVELISPEACIVSGNLYVRAKGVK